jgi:hypothetical protein
MTNPHKIFRHGKSHKVSKKEPLAKLEDLRDDCVALFIDSGLTQVQVHQRGGPTPATISKWLYRETKFPRMDTMRALMIALDCDIVMVTREAADRIRAMPRSERIGTTTGFLRRPTMPRKRVSK